MRYSMSTGFYYHTDDFDAEEFAAKCGERLDDIPADPDTVTLETKQQVEPADFFDSTFTDGWKTANYDDDDVIEYDVPYAELNDESRKREIAHLANTYGQFFVVVLSVESGESTRYCSALIEIQGRAESGKTAFYIKELVASNVDV